MSSSSMSQTDPNKPRHSTSSCVIRLVLDFDGTLTKKDTMHILAQAGYARQREMQGDLQPQPWADIVNAYMSDYKAHANAYLPIGSNRTTVAQEIAWLDSLRQIENASIERAIEAGIFDQLGVADITLAVNEALDNGNVQFRDGWVQILSAVEQHNTMLAANSRPVLAIQVISVNWSACFVRQVLSGCIERTSEVEDQTKSRWMENLSVYANEIPSLLRADSQMEGHGTPILTQHQWKGIRTSGDKVSVLNCIRDRTLPCPNAVFIYVGDSSTDLECLLAADVGICIRDEPISSGQKELAATLKRLDIEVLHVQGNRSSSSTNGRRMFWARNFGEIREWFDEHHESLERWQLPKE